MDAHTLANAGVILGGGVNTLAMARWTWPSRARGAGFTLESLGLDFLGYGKTEAFDDLFSEEYAGYRERARKVRGCECGAVTCRVRQSTPGHLRIERTEVVKTQFTARRPVPLEAVVPGHPLWARALKYSAQDALMALAVYELALRAMTKQRRDVPWILSNA